MMKAKHSTMHNGAILRYPHDCTSGLDGITQQGVL